MQKFAYNTFRLLRVTNVGNMGNQVTFRRGMLRVPRRGPTIYREVSGGMPKGSLDAAEGALDVVYLEY